MTKADRIKVQSFVLKGLRARRRIARRAMKRGAEHGAVELDKATKNARRVIQELRRLTCKVCGGGALVKLGDRLEPCIRCYSAKGER